MKSSENNSDDLLKKALQRRFDSFEAYPDPTLEDSIFHSLKPELKGGNVQHVLIFTFLIFIIFTTALLIFTLPKTETAGIQKNNFLSSNSGFLSDFSKENQELESVQQHNRKQMTFSFSKNNAEIKMASINNFGEINVRSVIKNSVPVSNQKKELTRNPAQRHISSANSKKDILAAINKKFVDANSDYESSHTENEALKGTEKETYQNTEPGAFTNDENVTAVIRTLQMDIKAGNKIAFSNTGFKKELNSIIVVPQRKYAPYFNKNERKWGLVLNAIGINTFQQITIKPANEITFRNFRFPSLSVQNLGYKFRAGMEKNGFQFLASYGQFKESFRYEIATDEFHVRKGTAENYKITRVIIPVKEETIRKFVGLGVQKHSRITKPALRGYYGDIGLEFARELTSSQNTFWGSAGIGKEIQINQNSAITLGPYINYSFTRLLNSKNTFELQPYQIGISVGLRH